MILPSPPSDLIVDVMTETGQVRIIRDPKRATNLYQSISVTLITPTPRPSNIQQKKYYQTRLHSVPLSVLLDPTFRISNLVGHTITPLTETCASLVPKSLHISLPQQSFHTLGLPASRRHAPPQSLPPSRRPFVPVCLNLPLTPKSLARARWALSPDRFPRFDVLLSTGSERIKPPVGVDTTETEVMKRVHKGRMNIPKLDDDETIWEAVENIQAVGTCMEEGEVDVFVADYRGLVNEELVEDCVRTARDVAKESGWAAVVARAPCAPVVWRNGISRGGFAEGFGGDAAEVFICSKTEAVSVQLRAGLDIT